MIKKLRVGRTKKRTFGGYIIGVLLDAVGGDISKIPDLIGMFIEYTALLAGLGMRSSERSFRSMYNACHNTVIPWLEDVVGGMTLVAPGPTHPKRGQGLFIEGSEGIEKNWLGKGVRLAGAADIFLKYTERNHLYLSENGNGNRPLIAAARNLVKNNAKHLELCAAKIKLQRSNEHNDSDVH